MLLKRCSAFFFVLKEVALIRKRLDLLIFSEDINDADKVNITLLNRLDSLLAEFIQCCPVAWSHQRSIRIPLIRAHKEVVLLT
jgi:hypothetical protein